MKFNSDDEVKEFVDSALGKVSDEGRFVAHTRLQRPYENLPADEVDIGHLEWQIYTRDEYLNHGWKFSKLTIRACLPIGLCE